MRLRKIFLLTNILLIGFILWVGFTIYRTWASTQAGTDQLSATNGKQTPGNHLPRKTTVAVSTFQSVIKSDIFKTHKTSEKSPARKTPSAAVKETELDLELKGTMIDETGERFAVILDGKTREQQTYVENDFVNGARIEKILADRIILSRKGAQEALLMSYESGPAPVRRQPRKAIRQRRIVRPPLRKKNIHAKRLPVKRFPAAEEGAGGP
ncbi:MAG: hypothetical protein JRI80_15450 [Deltaproteobacteria bacterium]|nr:hypothetical protein [Deltaproteobacteria bacterium]